MTAYRQQALDCAKALEAAPSHPRDLKATMPDAAKILQRNVYVPIPAISISRSDASRAVKREAHDGAVGCVG